MEKLWKHKNEYILYYFNNSKLESLYHFPLNHTTTNHWWNKKERCSDRLMYARLISWGILVFRVNLRVIRVIMDSTSSLSERYKLWLELFCFPYYFENIHMEFINITLTCFLPGRGSPLTIFTITPVTNCGPCALTFSWGAHSWPLPAAVKEETEAMFSLWTFHMGSTNRQQQQWFLRLV